MLFSEYAHMMAFILQNNSNLCVFAQSFVFLRPFASLVIFTQHCISGFVSLQLKVLCEFKELQTKH